MKTAPYKLMIPGPIQPEDQVMEAMGGQVQPHYGPVFRDFYNETTGLLGKSLSASTVSLVSGLRILLRVITLRSCP
jgi:aspartate aminotransferase-like enzyme